MRPVSLVLVFAACGGGGGDGAVLSFTAPEVPGAASRIEIVLASADDEAKTATRQRIKPGVLSEEEVVYFRQRSTVDAIVGVAAVDGFEVRIEPDETVVEDETFIPFALIYGDADALIAVGTVNDENGAPTSVLVRQGLVARYELAVIKLAPDADAAGVGPGQGHAVACQTTGGSWPSGAVWKPKSGPQIRLLLPDLAEDPEATDAMLRASDLDCDEHPADGRDCDDLRSAYHGGQKETCDGDDTDCDGRRLELIEGCQVNSTATCSAPGVSLCTEGPNDPVSGDLGACRQSAACGCEFVGGTRPQGCAACALGWIGMDDAAAPCAPGVGKLHVGICPAPGCTVDVVGADGPWEIKIGPTEAGPFASQLTGLTTGDVYLRAKYFGTAPFPASSTTLGAAYIAVTPLVGRPVLMPINLELDDAVVGQCAPSPTSGNNFMRCLP